VAVVVLASAMAAPSAAAAPHKDRFALGDSVMLGAKGDLKALGFATVDATESRQAYSGPALLRKRGTSLPTNVVIHLGTNGTLPLDVCKSMVKAVGPDRRVFFVTIHVPRSWEASNNKVIRACDAAFGADRVHVIDWDKAVSSHPGWLYSDGTHLRPTGAAAFAHLIDGSVDTAVRQARIDAINGASGSVSAGSSP
jgi:lysophospholipase L1-like esterase